MERDDLTREEALAWASKYGLEEEVKMAKERWCDTWREALAEWDIL